MMQPKKPTPLPFRMASSKTARKVKFSSGGAAGGAAVGGALCGAAQAFGLGIDEPLCLAIVTFASAVGSWLLGYYSRPSERDQVTQG